MRSRSSHAASGFGSSCSTTRRAAYILENFGSTLRLPELGAIGGNGLANPRDFQTPIAWYEDSTRPTQLIEKFLGKLWATDLDHSPFDVVAWHGNYAPYKYDLGRFNTIGSISFDHPDPSIYTVLNSPSEVPGTANADFVIFPTRWLVQEHTFRPPWFHRNVMNEFMGLIYGAYDSKAEGFHPGGASLHNCMSGHGPDVATWERAIDAELRPHKIEHSLAFMFETRWVCGRPDGRSGRRTCRTITTRRGEDSSGGSDGPAEDGSGRTRPDVMT